MLTNRLRIAVILPLLFAISAAQAAGSVASTMMSQAMLSMMDIMGDLAQQYRSNRRWSQGYVPFDNVPGGAPMALYAMPGGIPGQQQMHELPSIAQQSAQSLGSLPGSANRSPLDGIWQGQGGEIVLVMYGHFRIYADAKRYRDGRYEIRDNLIVMHDPQTGNSRAYEYAFKEGRMVMRDRDGNLLLFRQLPIPIPSYSLISGQQPRSTGQQTGTNQ